MKTNSLVQANLIQILVVNYKKALMYSFIILNKAANAEAKSITNNRDSQISSFRLDEFPTENSKLGVLAYTKLG